MTQQTTHHQQSAIRNFSIIAHIDHGKSTLADCFLEFTKAVDERHKKEQFLDRMDLERERGITIKAQTVRLSYKAKDGLLYQLNLIDTPGHVDFSYEVSRSLSACEGVLLVVDASQGVEAQTLAHASLAVAKDMVIIPVLNKIDLTSARPDEVSRELEELVGVKKEDILLVSARDKIGIQDVLEKVVRDIPPPACAVSAQGKKAEVSSGKTAGFRTDARPSLRALIFDSWFDSYQGVVTLCRIMEGSMRTGDEVLFMQGGKKTAVTQLGVFNPFPCNLTELKTGEVGFVITGVKDIKEVIVGDTLTLAGKPAPAPLKGFKKLKPMVFSSLFPSDSGDFAQLKTALEKLSLNDSSLTFEKENSPALGFGFRCGFLGLLHLEIVQERLEREFNLNLIVTAPSVIYKVRTKAGKTLTINNPSDWPDPSSIDRVEEPLVRVSIHAMNEYVGGILKLCEDRRGEQIRIEYGSSNRVIIEYRLPMSEIVTDFHDRLKSVSRGYGSMEYEWMDFAPSRLIKLDVLLNGEKVDALSVILHHSKAQQKGRTLTAKLKELIPRQQYQVAIQAAIGSKIIARETLSALRKDVTAKCYGGDVTRKRKLLEKQKKGKRRMKAIGRVDVPQSAFMAILKPDD